VKIIIDETGCFLYNESSLFFNGISPRRRIVNNMKNQRRKKQ